MDRLSGIHLPVQESTKEFQLCLISHNFSKHCSQMAISPHTHRHTLLKKYLPRYFFNRQVSGPVSDSGLGGCSGRG